MISTLIAPSAFEKFEDTIYCKDDDDDVLQNMQIMCYI